MMMTMATPGTTGRRRVYAARRPHLHLGRENGTLPTTLGLFCSELAPRVAPIIDMCCKHMFKFQPPPSVISDAESTTYTYENKDIYEYEESALLTELRGITLRAKETHALTDDVKAHVQKTYNRAELITHGILECISKLDHGACGHCASLRAALVVQFVYCPVWRSSGDGAAPSLRIGSALAALTDDECGRCIFNTDIPFTPTQLTTFRYWAPGRATPSNAAAATTSATKKTSTATTHRPPIHLLQYDRCAISTETDDWCLCKLTAPGTEQNKSRTADIYMITRRPMLSCALARLNLLAIPPELADRIRVEYMIRPLATPRACLDVLEVIHALSKDGEPCAEAIVQGIWESLRCHIEFLYNSASSCGDTKHVIPCVKL